MGKRASLCVAGLVVLAAAALRLIHPGMYELWWDEVLTQYHAVQLARHGEWVWVGNPMSAGQALYHSPFGVYVTALPYFVSSHVIGPRLLYGVLGTLTVVSTLVFVQRYYDWPSAILAALLVAVNPLAIYWSRFAWHPNIAAPCIVLWIMTGVLGYYEDKRWAQIAHWLLLSMIFQADTALGVIIPLSVGLVIVKRAWHKTTALAVGLAGLTLIPWVIGLVGVHQGWFVGPPSNDLGRSINYLAIPSPRAIAENVGLLMGRYGYHLNTLAVSDHHADWWPDKRLNIFLAVHTIVIVAGWVYLLRQRWPARFIAIVLVWPLVFLFYSGDMVFDFYMMASVFAADVIFGIVFGRLWKWHRLTILVAVALISAQAWLTLALLDREQRSDQVFSLSELQDMVHTWVKAGGEVVVLDESQPGEAARLQREWRMKWQILGEQYPIRLVTEPHAFPVAARGETLVSVTGGSVIPDMIGEGTLITTPQRTFRWITVKASDFPPCNFLPGGEFSGLMQVIGVSAHSRQDELWPLLVVWQPLKTGDHRYHFSVRLVGSDGTSYGQVDGSSLEPNLWRKGDLVFTRFFMPPLANSVEWHVELLLYSWPEIVNVPIAGQDGVVMRLQAR